MTQRESICLAVLQAITTACPDARVERDREEPFADSMLPAINLRRESDRLGARGGNKDKRELSFAVEVYTKGAGRAVESDGLETAIYEALVNVPAVTFGCEKLAGGDADFDQADAMLPHQSARLAFTATYFVPTGTL